MNRAEYDAAERELLKARESLRKVQERTETIRKGGAGRWRRRKLRQSIMWICSEIQC